MIKRTIKMVNKNLNVDTILGFSTSELVSYIAYYCSYKLLVKAGIAEEEDRSETFSLVTEELDRRIPGQE